MQINPSIPVSIFSNDPCSGAFELLPREQFQAYHNVLLHVQRQKSELSVNELIHFMPQVLMPLMLLKSK
jgi:hypothetical protein